MATVSRGIVNKFSTGFATLVINNYKFHSASREACWKPRSLTSGQNTDPIVWCNVWFDLHRAGIKKSPFNVSLWSWPASHWLRGFLDDANWTAMHRCAILLSSENVKSEIGLWPCVRHVATTWHLTRAKIWLTCHFRCGDKICRTVKSGSAIAWKLLRPQARVMA